MSGLVGDQGPGARSQPAGSVAAVDAGAHAWPRGLVHPAQVSPEPLGSDSSDLLAAADAAGVAIVLTVPASIHLDNRWVLEQAAAAPDRLRAIVTVDPTDPTQVVQLPIFAGAGALGVRVRPGSLPQDGRSDEGALRAFVDTAADLGLAVQWTLRLPATRPIELAVAWRPELRQVLDHLGLPTDVTDTAALARLRALAGVSGLAVKLSGLYACSQEPFPYTDTWPWIEGAVEAFGPERVMWASDWPLSAESAAMADQLALIERLDFLDEVGRVAITGGTARSFWRLGD